jgi:hypothetical protein
MDHFVSEKKRREENIQVDSVELSFKDTYLPVIPQYVSAQRILHILEVPAS